MVQLLLSGSYLKVYEANRILNTDQVLTAEVTLQGQTYDDQQDRRQFWERLCEQLHTLPGVQSVGVTTKLPLEGGNNRSVLIDDQIYETGTHRECVEQSFITPSYFAAMGIPLLNGDLMNPDTSTDSSVELVINRAMAEEYWPESKSDRRPRPSQ